MITPLTPVNMIGRLRGHEGKGVVLEFYASKDDRRTILAPWYIVRGGRVCYQPGSRLA